MHPPPNAAVPLSVADLLAILARRRLAALAALLLVAALGATALAMHRPMYRATALLSIDRDLKPVEFRGDGSARTVQDGLVNTQRELLLSRDVLAEAVRMAGLAQDPPYSTVPDPLDLMAVRLQVAVARDSWVIAATYTDEDPRRAERALQAVIDAHSAGQSRLARERAAQATAFLERQVQEAAAALDQANNRERQFRTERGLTGTDPEQSPLARRLLSLVQRKASVEDLLAASDAQLRLLRGADAQKDPERRRAQLLHIERIAGAPSVAALQAQLNQLGSTRAQLAEKYLDRHPRMLEIDGQIKARQAQLDGAVAQVRNGIESDHQGLVDQRAALDRTIQEAERELSAYREDLQRLDRLVRESQGQAVIHQQLVARLAQERITASLEQDQLVVRARPQAGGTPVGIGRTVILLATAVAGVLGACAMAVTAELADPRLGDPLARLRRAGVAVIGVLPRLRTRAPLAATGPAMPARLAEAVRVLQSRILAQLAEAPSGQVLAVTSPSRGDGRTTLAARLAATCAAGGLRVLVVDADLRSPALSGELGVEPGPGLCELLHGEPDIACMPTGMANLDAMPAGDPAGYAPELLHSHCLGEWLDFVRARYDLVVLDAPPLGEGADALVLAGHADRVLLGVRPGASLRRDLDAGLDDLDRGRLLGAVLLASDAAGTADE